MTITSIAKSLPLPQIAETQRYADMAAKQVIIEYDTEDLGPLIITAEQAVEKSSYFDVPPEERRRNQRAERGALAGKTDLPARPRERVRPRRR